MREAERGRDRASTKRKSEESQEAKEVEEGGEGEGRDSAEAQLISTGSQARLFHFLTRIKGTLVKRGTTGTVYLFSRTRK